MDEKLVLDMRNVYDNGPHNHTVQFDKSASDKYVVDLNALPAGVAKLTLTDVDVDKTKVSFCADGYELITCAPDKDGTVVFWEGWSWKRGAAKNVSIVIVSPSPPTATFQLQHSCYFAMVKIPHQTFVPNHPMFHGTDCNNALLFVDGQVTLRYTN